MNILTGLIIIVGVLTFQPVIVGFGIFFFILDRLILRNLEDQRDIENLRDRFDNFVNDLEETEMPKLPEVPSKFKPPRFKRTLPPYLKRLK